MPCCEALSSTTEAPQPHHGRTTQKPSLSSYGSQGTCGTGILPRSKKQRLSDLAVAWKAECLRL